MALKKSQLYSSIWKSCDELRGGMDASQYKDYVLVLLFVKYISDKYAGVPYAPIVIPEGASFKDMVALKGKSTIGDDINKKIIEKIEAANKSLGNIAVDFNDPTKLGSDKDMVQRLTKLIAIFENPALDFSTNRAEGDDILGDAYEYLMRHFATESGKSKGQFYTPAEVSRIIAKVIGIAKTENRIPTVYDPTCGSGSLLLKVGDETDKNVRLFGQEMDNATASLARMNMILHNNPTALIMRENTLSTPLFLENDQLKTFDFVVANPPFSFKSWSNGVLDPDTYGRFKEYGTPPTKNGDYAFLLHIIKSLKSDGKGACILPHGVLFRGNAEAEIRTNIINKGFIKGIIGMPANLFYGTGIPACIIVLDKENADNRKGIFMIDASKGFVKDGNKNRLRAQDIHKIVDTFNRQQEIPKYSRMVSITEIEKNEYNLNLPRYIDSQEPEDLQNIEAHLKGGIPVHDVEELSSYWSVYPHMKASLFQANATGDFYSLKIPAEEVKPHIYSHPEFTTNSQKMEATFDDWKLKTTTRLKGLTTKLLPKEIIGEISEQLLTAFDHTQLIDKYDIYQHLMAYWSDVMQDDLYLIKADGWRVELIPVEGKKGEVDCDLVPKNLVINHYFPTEKLAIENLQIKQDSVSQELAELIEENSDDEELSEDDLKATKEYKELKKRESEAKKAIKEAQKLLDHKVAEKYIVLTEGEIKKLVVDEKWLATIELAVKGEMDRISQRLTARIKELADRYTITLPELVKETELLNVKVNEHLKKMGFEV